MKVRAVKGRLVIIVCLFAVACVSQSVEPPGTTLPSATDPPATQPPPIVIPAGASWTDAINATQSDSTLIAGPDDHGNKDLSNLDARGVTIECQPDTKVRRFRLTNVSHLTLRNCVMTPETDTIGVYIVGGSDIHVEGFTITGGERSVLIQNNRAKIDGWTDGVWIEHGTFSTPKIDTVAVYGGRNIHVLNNHMVLDTLGCSFEHSDALQTNAVIGLEAIGNLIENNGLKDPAVGPGEQCPQDSTHPTEWFQSDQGVVLTQADAGLDQATDVLIRDNTILRWRSGFPILVDDTRAKNVRIVNNRIGCSLRTAPRVTGSGGGVTVSGNTVTTDC